MRDGRWRRWELIGLLVTLAAGNLLHFVFDWMGQNEVAGAFASVNESVWEHMKLLAVPWILWSLVEALALRKEHQPILMARALGLLTGLAAISILYYTYVGITGTSVQLVDVLIFQIAVLLAFWCSRRVNKTTGLRGLGWNLLGLLLLLGIWAVFVMWTYAPPSLPLFTDPQTGQTGIPTGLLQ